MSRRPDVTGRREAALLAVVALLFLCAFGAMARDAVDRPQQLAAAREFQSLVRGFGFGPASDLSGCWFALDPRLSRGCSRDLGPLPLGAAYCPRHFLTAFSYRWSEGNRNARTP